MAELPDNLFTELLPNSFKRQQEYCEKMDKTIKDKRMNGTELERALANGMKTFKERVG